MLLSCTTTSLMAGEGTNRKYAQHRIKRAINYIIKIEGELQAVCLPVPGAQIVKNEANMACKRKNSGIARNHSYFLCCPQSDHLRQTKPNLSGCRGSSTTGTASAVTRQSDSGKADFSASDTGWLCILQPSKLIDIITTTAPRLSGP